MKFYFNARTIRGVPALHRLIGRERRWGAMRLIVDIGFSTRAPVLAASRDVSGHITDSGRPRPMSETVRNWAGSVEIQPARVHRPGSVDELRRVVAAAESVRAFGTGHSFNRIADTDGDLVLTGGLPAEVEIDADARTATLAAGMRLADIATRLHAAG